ncbi:MAG: lipid-A-disaccharide synthase N-terminal domain-containing protein [Phycisphaerae bacterium]
MTITDFATSLRDPLVLFGLSGQVVFMFRFVVQWWASERRGRSHVPIAFWYLSLAGGFILLLYAIKKGEPVILAAQIPAMPIYIRNLWLIHTRATRLRERVKAFEAARVIRGPVSATASAAAATANEPLVSALHTDPARR